MDGPDTNQASKLTSIYGIYFYVLLSGLPAPILLSPSEIHTRGSYLYMIYKHNYDTNAHKLFVAFHSSTAGISTLTSGYLANFLASSVARSNFCSICFCKCAAKTRSSSGQSLPRTCCESFKALCTGMNLATVMLSVSKAFWRWKPSRPSAICHGAVSFFEWGLACIQETGLEWYIPERSSAGLKQR